jgi:hypothetical protein
MTKHKRDKGIYRKQAAVQAGEMTQDSWTKSSSYYHAMKPAGQSTEHHSDVSPRGEI